MSEILEREAEAKAKAIQTMMYPMAIMGLSVLTLGVLMAVALPPLLDTFDKLGADLPLMTKIAIGGATGLQEHFVKLALGLVGFVVAFVIAGKFARVRYWMDALKVKVPILGSLVVASQIARISRTSAMLLEAEVGLAPALQLARTGIGNALIRKAFDDAEESLVSGHGIAVALARHPVLPSMFVQLMTIGEASNSLARTMADAATAYQKEFDGRLNTILGMLEPASTLVVGGIVGFIAMSMFVPIYSGISAIE
jgi:type II secretory pathway component PulF